MRNTGIYLLACLIAACSHANPKEAIVERQKEIKREMQDRKDSILRLPPITYTDSTREAAIELEAERGRVNFALQKEYDSLEVELKKY